jgi:hypothetical protein
MSGVGGSDESMALAMFATAAAPATVASSTASVETDGWVMAKLLSQNAIAYFRL